MARNKVPLVYFHGSCPDGTTSAWVAWKFFGGKADFQPLYHGQPFRPPTENRPIYMFDFCLKKAEEMKRLEALAKPYKFVVGDHHDFPAVRTAIKAVRNGIFRPGISGARIAWEYFFPDRDAPPVIDFTEDRDLWKWRLQDSQEVNAWISSFPLDDPAQWELNVAAPLERAFPTFKQMVSEGASILRYQQRCFDNAADRSRLYDVPVPGGGVKRVPGANVGEGSFQSEVAGRLSKGYPFAFTWSLGANGQYKFSFRRRGEESEGFHLGKLCAFLSENVAGGVSGGGHPMASGCEFDRLPSFLIRGYNRD